MPRRCPTPARRPSISSGGESSFGGNISDGYTSGAFNTDEDPYQVGSISGTDGVSETGPTVLLGLLPARLALRSRHPLPEVGTAALTTSHYPSLDGHENPM